VLYFELVDSPHISKERLNALLYDTVRLTEEEGAHISGGRCPECQKTMLELAMNPLTPSKDDDSSGSAE
jgi:hypothetical protein